MCMSVFKVIYAWHHVACYPKILWSVHKFVTLSNIIIPKYKLKTWNMYSTRRVKMLFADYEKNVNTALECIRGMYILFFDFFYSSLCYLQLSELLLQQSPNGPYLVKNSLLLTFSLAHFVNHLKDVLTHTLSLSLLEYL